MSSAIRAVALDLDGTLTNSAKEVAPRVREAVRRAARAGVAVVLASGRPVVGMAHVADALGLGELGGYVLSNNGSKIVSWRDGGVLLDRTLPRVAVSACCGAARAFGVDALAYDEEGLYAEDTAARYVEKERFNNSAKATEVDDLESAITWSPNKMMVVGDPDRLAPVVGYLRGRLAGAASVFLSEPYFVEVAPPGVGKDSSLGVLMDWLGLGLSNLMVVGDGLNDIPMLECAGLAVAMGNAYPQVKELADWVAPSNDEDGAAVAIERFILEEETAC